jgi:hypothetical protein
MWPEMGAGARPPLVPVGITNRDEREAPNGSVQQLLAPDFSPWWCYHPGLMTSVHINIIPPPAT